MGESIVIGGMKVTARDLIAGGKATSWPDIFSTDVHGLSVRWQYANSKGPCTKTNADRVLIPFAHGKIPKGTELLIRG